MNFITAAKLQREFGLPIMQASSIIEAHHAAAFRRYLPLTVSTWGCLLIACGPEIFDFHLPKGLAPSLWLVAVALIFLKMVLVQKASREPILAAARAWRSHKENEVAH